MLTILKSAYAASLHDEAIIVNGGLSNQQVQKLRSQLFTKLEDDTLINKIVDDFVVALENNPSMSYAEMLERLGISNKEFNLKKITENLSKGRVDSTGNVQPSVVKRVLDVQSDRNIPLSSFHIPNT